MSFWDDLTNSLDELIGPGINSKESQTSFGNANYFSSTGINPFSDGFTPPLKDPRELKIEEQLATIKRKNIAFQTIDIEPFRFQGPEFKVTIPRNDLFNLVGYEGENDTTFKSDIAPTSLDMSAWRTLQLSISGNFLKIEYLPPKINFADPTNSQSPVSTFQGKELATYKEDQSYSPFARTSILSSGPAAAPANGAFTRYGMARTMNPTILLQFDDTTGPILMGKNGDTYETSFTSVSVTFKVGAPRFRIIVGNNSKINSDDAGNRILRADPAFGPGFGLWDNSSRHCVPFCFTDEDQGSLGAGRGNGNQGNKNKYVLAALNNTNVDLFWNNQAPFTIAIPTSGVAVGWITSISASIINTDGNTSAGANAIALARLTLFNFRSSGAGNDKQYLSLPLAGIHACTVNKTFTTPVRFMLKPNDKLRLGIFNMSTTNSIILTFSIEGYLYGRIGESSGNTLTDVPFNYTPDTLTTNPFPLDSLNETSAP